MTIIAFSFVLQILMVRIIQLFLIASLYIGCGGEDPVGMPTTPVVIPDITIEGANTNEGTSATNAVLNISLNSAPDSEVTVDYKTESRTAEAGKDFEATQGTLSIPAGARTASITVPILVDTDKELEETFAVLLSNPKNAKIGNTTGIVTLKDNDEANNEEGEGYSTPNSLTGYSLVWGDEFDGSTLDESNWTFEIGDGCDKGLCGWGNNELQIYSSNSENIKLENGSLVITALEDAPYSSSRIITQDKREFKFGRIDIRAKLPKGQGIWPAIWMLGANIDEVSWPACGEIDIMEMVGHEAKVSHSTVHWGRAGEGSQFKGNSFFLKEDFAERFHVFTLLWKNNSLQFYVDETFFYEITPSDTQGFLYPFNEEFFFIMNVAVGGNWPGSPDETTEFPQSMEVDYLRVFQEN